MLRNHSNLLFSNYCALFRICSKYRPNVFIHLRTLCALRKMSTSMLSTTSALFGKNTRVGGSHPMRNPSPRHVLSSAPGARLILTGAGCTCSPLQTEEHSG